MAWVAVAAAATTVVGNKVLNGGSHQSGNATTTQQQQLDPRISNMLFGDGTSGNAGLLSQYQGMLNTPQSDALHGYGQAAGDYLTQNGAQDMGAIHGAATGLMAGQQAPMSAAARASSANMTGAGMTAAQADIPSYAVGNMVNAPAQNNINLTDSYQRLLGGGDTTALNNSMNAAVNATNAGFKTNQDNVTNSLMRTVLPGISQNAVLAGQYGGSRQGVAEGNAISDYTNQLTNANSQLGATNSANTTAQAAQAYQQGQDRALAATQGLGAQQYGVASQNANTKNQAEFMNVGNQFDASKTNAGLNQQARMTNAGLDQQTNLTNAGFNQQTNLANAGFNQQTNLANQGSQLQTNGQNNNAAVAGAGLLSGLNNTAYTAATNDQNYGINRASQVNGLLAPYLGANSGSTTTQPLYQNTAGNMLGGALLGSQLGGNLFGNLGGANISSGTGSAGNLLNQSQFGTFEVPQLPMWHG